MLGRMGNIFSLQQGWRLISRKREAAAAAAAAICRDTQTGSMSTHALNTSSLRAAWCVLQNVFQGDTDGYA